MVLDPRASIYKEFILFTALSLSFSFFLLFFLFFSTCRSIRECSLLLLWEWYRRDSFGAPGLKENRASDRFNSPSCFAEIALASSVTFSFGESSLDLLERINAWRVEKTIGNEFRISSSRTLRTWIHESFGILVANAITQRVSEHFSIEEIISSRASSRRTLSAITSRRKLLPLRKASLVLRG